jgi:hypothetical protein
MLLSLSERVGRLTDSQPTEPTASCVTGRRSNLSESASANVSEN